MKRGLVLEGGGGKGAFQAGAIKALYEAGYRFDAVAGTSVGALNAAALACGRVAEVLRFWECIRPARVRRHRFPAPLFLLLQAIYVGCLALNFVALGRTQSVEARIRKLVETGVNVGCLTVFIGVGAPLGVAVGLLTWAEVVDGWQVVFYPALIFTPLAFAFAFPIVYEYANISVFSTQPLRDTVQAVLDRRMPHIPTYVTGSRRISVFDPTAPSYTYLGTEFGPLMSYPAPRARFVPSYIRLDQIQDWEDREQALMASTALPFGIFPGWRIEEHLTSDGGTSDNRPLLPLLRHEEVDELWIVALRPIHPLTSFLEAEGQRIADIERLQALSAADPDHVMQRFEKASDKSRSWTPPAAAELIWPRRVIVIAPDSSLGGFLMGTLNFRRGKARRLIAEGEAAARRAIAAAELLGDGLHYFTGAKETDGVSGKGPGYN